MLLEPERQLETLAAARRAAAGGEGSVVLVAGEPGIGKTALVSHFVAGLDDGARVLWGPCDDLSIPRPFAPLRDMAGSCSAPLARAPAGSAPPTDLHALVISELRAEPAPTLFVVEDLYWADDATLDVITVLGRRVSPLPAVVILTFRDSELSPSDRLRLTLGSLPSSVTRHLLLDPLSPAAVGHLAGRDADRVYAVTRGNPFFVTELVAAGPTGLPPSVSDAVLARVARLDADARRLLELVSAIPARTDVTLLDTLMPGWAPAAEKCERRRLLDVGNGSVRFRHELARVAVASSHPGTRRRRVHGEILAVLLASGADAADIVHHAEAAGDTDVLADHSLVAARNAVVAASNREAYAHFRRAAEFGDRYPPTERAALFEELAVAAYTAGHLGNALPAIERAIALHRAAADRAALGRCTRVLSRLHWYSGDGQRAWSSAREAVRLLAPLGDSLELACAYSCLSQLAMLSSNVEETIAWGERAVELTQRLGDNRTLAHAMVNLGVARLELDPDDSEMLLRVHAVADAAGDHHEGVRALLSLAYHEMSWVRPEQAVRYGTRAATYAAEHEIDTLGGYVATMIAWLRLRAGEWPEAERIARGELEKGTTVAQLLARTVLTELAVRRGDRDAGARLATIGEQADQTRELQRIETGSRTGDRMVAHHGRAAAGRAVRPGARHRGGAGSDHRLGSGPAHPVGADRRSPRGVRRAAAPAPRGDVPGYWVAAADAFGAVGWDYDRALMLSLLDDERALGEALGTARRLGAAPLTQRVSRRLREVGLPVPRGPSAATRAHPAGLTARQCDVLRLLAEGFTNAEIGDRLHMSPRTAEHHVTAVLTKLGVRTRREVARLAVTLLDGGSPPVSRFVHQ